MKRKRETAPRHHTAQQQHTPTKTDPSDKPWYGDATRSEPRSTHTHSEAAETAVRYGCGGRTGTRVGIRASHRAGTHTDTGICPGTRASKRTGNPTRVCT